MDLKSNNVDIFAWFVKRGNDRNRIGVRSFVVDFLAYNVKRLEREEKNIIGFKSFVMDITGSLVFYARPT